MSASETPSPGTAGTTPNGTAPKLPAFLRRKPANPLVQKQPPLQRRPQQTSTPNANGSLRPLQPGQRRPSPSVGRGASQDPSPPEGPYKDYPVYTTKRTLREGLRYHIMRFLPNTSASKKVIDPTNESQFTRPVRLHRRDPRIKPQGNWKEGGSDGEDVEDKAAVMDEKERARLEAQKAERRAEREANQAQIAPVAKPTAKPRNKFQKKTEQVYAVTDSASKKKDMQLRYEEALPWHIEDFDNKNTWVGTYEAALSDSHLLFFPDKDEHGADSYSMVPVEKWYKFTPKNQFKALTIEEAEARMNKKSKDPRWFMETQLQSERRARDEYLEKSILGLFTRKGERGERPGRRRFDEDHPEEAIDADDIDYDYKADFADDEENPLFGGNDEENKEAEDKISREQREANVFQLKEEKDYDKEEEEEKRKARDAKKLSKKTQKALMKREKNFVYEDDSDENPYTEQSESEDSEVERQRAEELKQKEFPKEDGAALSSEKIPSGASSRGTNTPSNRLSKQGDGRKGALKRPGSPNLSEASGNESSSRKVKKSKTSNETVMSGGASISRPTSPSNDPLRKSSNKIKSESNTPGTMTPRGSSKRSAPGSGSDGEGSDRAGRAKQQKSSRNASPSGSRAVSPSAAQRRPQTLLPTPEEIRAVIPTEGIGLTEFLKSFSNRQKSHPDFMNVVKENAKYAKKTKIFYPKGAVIPATTEETAQAEAGPTSS